MLQPQASTYVAKEIIYGDVTLNVIASSLALKSRKSGSGVFCAMSLREDVCFHFVNYEKHVVSLEGVCQMLTS